MRYPQALFTAASSVLKVMLFCYIMGTATIQVPIKSKSYKIQSFSILFQAKRAATSLWEQLSHE